MYNHPASSQQLSQAYSSITNNINSSTHKIENSNTTRVLRDLALFKEEIQNTLVALAKAQHITNVALLDIKKLLKNNSFEESIIKIRETGTNTPELEISSIGIQSGDLSLDKNNIKVFIDSNNGKNARTTTKDDSSVYYSS
tara:strand:- start:266 stop:688 length:423 start_codon:yes stop_codon:yes gene_type:complete